MEGSVFTPPLKGMQHIKSPEGGIITKPFLDVCKLIMPGIDKFGANMKLVKSDIRGNISRLEKKYQTNTTKYNYLYYIVKEEVESKAARDSSSCTNGLLWLTRGMDFLIELYRNLLAHPEWTMTEACTDSYGKTLKMYHGHISRSISTFAIKLAPDRKKFMDVLACSGGISADMEKFCSVFPPFLKENHKILANFGLDDMKA